MSKKIRKVIQFYFKKFFQFFFKILHGRIHTIINANECKNINISKVHLENINYKVFTITDGRLYTDRINDAAVIVNNKLIEGPSYQLRSKVGDEFSPRNNSSAKNNIVLTKGTPRFKKKIDKTILSLLSGGGANKNYFHWLFDVLPRIHLFENLKDCQTPYNLFCPDYELSYQKQSLNLLGFDKNKIISSRKNRHLQFKKLLVTDHPYNIIGDTKIDHQNIPKWISIWLRDKFLSFNKNNIKFEKIFIDRRDVDPENLANRRIENDLELRQMLLNHNYKFVKLQEFSFEDQISIFSNAKKIIGLHGAGFANIVFCKPGTEVVEIRTNTTNKIIESIALLNKLNFKGLEFDTINSKDKQNGVIKVSIDVIKKII